LGSRNSVLEGSLNVCRDETKLKRASTSLLSMLRSLLAVPGVVADYTVGTVIVFVQLTLKRRTRG